MASDAVYISREAFENALVAQAVMGADMQTLAVLAINFGVEKSFLERVERLRRDVKAVAPFLLVAGEPR